MGYEVQTYLFSFLIVLIIVIAVRGLLQTAGFLTPKNNSHSGKHDLQSERHLPGKFLNDQPHF